MKNPNVYSKPIDCLFWFATDLLIMLHHQQHYKNVWLSYSQRLRECVQANGVLCDSSDDTLQSIINDLESVV